MINDEFHESSSQLVIKKRKENSPKLNSEKENLANLQKSPMIMEFPKKKFVFKNPQKMDTERDKENLAIEVPKRKILSNETNIFEAQENVPNYVPNLTETKSVSIANQQLQVQRQLVMSKLLDCLKNEQEITKLEYERNK